ncbi:ATP synthase F1 subunit delta [Desulfoluna sp.]|uniref:ATP synthase F1 subunit delta n=1 Tax=Desulfoluna sp. TaxID=2045199 RepID=UPI00262D0960|nr:ATP synthase F1 subunit delta [Desulfoluna sp.]
MKDIAISRRYAKALLLIGKEDGNAEAYRGELSGLASFLAKEVELSSVIINPVYELDGRRGVLKVVVEKLNLSPVIASFTLLLFDKGRFGHFGSIDETYQALVDEFNGVAHAYVVSAVGLSEDAVEKIKASLSALTGKDVILNLEKDPGLIGGIVTKIGDLVLDGSVRTQLQNMKESFKRGESV